MSGIRLRAGAAAPALGRGGSDRLLVLDNLLFALGMARSTYVARICEKPEDITPSIYTGLAINHVASIAYGVLGGVIWMNTGGPQAVFLIGGVATAGAGLVARRMDRPQGT